VPKEKTEQIHVAVTPERKEEWQEHAKEHPNINGSLSQLIRLAVEREIADTGAGGEGLNEEASGRLSEILEQNRSLQSQLQGIEARLGSVERAVQEDPELQSLANEVFAVLPDKKEIQEFDDPEAGSVPPWLPEDQGGPLVYSGNVDDIATLLGQEPAHITDAIEKLQKDTALIQTTSDGRYYKEQ
jgi:hypothetical protein